jgi:hypothetical protein
MSRMCWVIFGIVLVAGVSAGCGREPAVITLEGRQVPLNEVVFEYDRLNGLGEWEKASDDVRRAFVDTYAKKEVIVREALSVYGGQLPAEQAKQLERDRDRRAHELFMQAQSADVTVTPGEVDSLVDLMRVQRRISDISCKSEADAKEISRCSGMNTPR